MLPTTPDSTGPRTWILTDGRYLRQRMPIAAIEWLRSRGHAPRVVLAEDAAGEWAGLEAGDLVVARSRHPLAAGLQDAAVARGARSLHPTASVQRVRDKAACALALARSGLPIPETVVVRRPGDLRRLPETMFPIVLKPVFGDNARGVRIIRTPAALVAVAWSGEVLLAQAYVDAGGFDIKLYVAGDRVWATRRPSPLVEAGAPATHVAVTPALRRIAEGCRREFGLTLFGVDVLESDGHLAIVDVNEFPNYTGLDEAPEVIGALLIAEGAAGAAARRQAA
ncbi:MAG: ATP-grasp domain-containing protein [Solirubrobacteraceae bacterium]